MLLKEFRQKIVIYLNEINNFCVKKAFQSMNFHDLTLGARAPRKSKRRALARALNANFRPSASMSVERVHHCL
jgi:hypothetical protein